MRLAIVLGTTVASAAFFAALHPAPRDAYEAVGTLVIPVRGLSNGEIEARTHQAAELLRQPNIVAEALERSYQASEPGRTLEGLRVAARPEAGIVRFSVRAAANETAARLGEELGRVTVETLQRGSPTGDRFGLRVAGDFEFDNEKWSPTGTETGLASIGLVPHGRYGGGALRSLCEVVAGCGVSRVLAGRFPAGRTLTMTAWLRGRRPSRILVVLSGGRNEDRQTKIVEIGREWQRVAVRWTPTRLESRVVLAVMNAGPGLSDVDLDGVLLNSAGRTVTGERERRIFVERSYAYAAPVRVVSSSTGSTLRWAAIGAGAGLVVGLVGAFAWTFALRRSQPLRG